MPTYEYRCTACDHIYDTVHKMSDKPLITCPKCSKNTLKRVIGGKDAILNFQGSGFYITDYVKKKESS